MDSVPAGEVLAHIGSDPRRRSAPPGPWRRLRSVRPWLASVVVIVGAALVFFNPIARGLTFSVVPNHETAIWPWAATPTGAEDTFPQTDQADSFHPWQVFIGESLRDGDLPLWNPHSFGGAPFLTNGQNGALYPPRAGLSLVASASWVHDLLSLLNVTFAGLAMLGFLRILGLHWLACLFGALAWEFSSYTMGWLQLESVGPLVASLPAALLFAHLAHTRRSVGWSLCCGAALGIGALGGTLTLVVVVYVITAGYLASLSLSAFARDRNGRQLLVRTALFGTACLIGLLLPAVMLLPTFLETRGGGRTAIPFGELTRLFAISWKALLRDWFLTPALPAKETTLNNQLAFAGTGVAVFSLIGVFCRRHSATLGRTLVILSAILVTGNPAARVLYAVVPGLDFVKPTGRLLFVFVFGTTLLAAIGFSAMANAFWGRLAKGTTRETTPWPHAPMVVGSAVALLIVAVNTLQLFSFGRGVNPPFQPREQLYLYPRTPAITALTGAMTADPQESPGRLLPLRSADASGAVSAPVLYASHQMVFGLDSAAGYESLLPQRTIALWRVVAGEDASVVADQHLQTGYIASYVTSTARLDLLPRLAINAIITPPSIQGDPHFTGERQRAVGVELRYRGTDGSVFSVDGAQPRAWFVTNAVVATSARDALLRFTAPTFAYRKSVVLETPTDPASAQPSAPAKATVHVTPVGPNGYALSVAADRPGWLVVANSYDRGWRATVNGRGRPLVRANFAFMAIALPAGQSEVELRYRPPAFTVGLWLTLLTCITLLLATVRRLFTSGSGE